MGREGAGCSAELGEPPLVVASTAVLALAEAFWGAVPEAKACCTAASRARRRPARRSVGLGLDSLAEPGDRGAVPPPLRGRGRHAKRGLAIARPRARASFPVLVPVLGNVLHLRDGWPSPPPCSRARSEAARLSGNAQALGWNLLSRAFTAVAAGDLETAVAAAEESARDRAATRRRAA